VLVAIATSEAVLAVVHSPECVGSTFHSNLSADTFVYLNEWATGFMNIADVDLRLLRVFLAVVRSGGFTPAQAVLNISQSTVSNHVRSLEERLGFRLCTRGRAGFQLTTEGEKIVESADRLLRSIEVFQTESLALKGRLAGELRIGLVDNLTTDPDSPVIACLRALTSQSGEIRPYITIGDPQTLELEVAGGRLDAAIGVFPAAIASLHRVLFYGEKQAFYCARDHVLFRSQRVTISDIRKARVISRSYWNLADIKRLGIRRFGAIANSMEAALALIKTGNFVGFLPIHVAAPLVDRGELRRLLPATLAYRAEVAIIARASAVKGPILSLLFSLVDQMSSLENAIPARRTHDGLPSRPSSKKLRPAK
jgi:DNA-binding transcriptional LysR family regulator